MNTLHPGASAARIFASPIGPHPVLEAPDMPKHIEHLLTKFGEHHSELKSFITASTDKIEKLAKDRDEANARLMEIEQKMVRSRNAEGGRQGGIETPGQALIESEEFKSLAAMSGSGQQGRRARVEIKTVSTLTSLTGSTGGLVAPDYRVAEAVPLPRRRLMVRDLVAPGQTESNLVIYVRQTARQLNQAIIAAEGNLKPQSDLTLAIVQAPVQTIAHWMLASRQILDDAAGLRSLVDGELVYGLALLEETQMLNGDGTGVNLLGIVPTATAYSAPFTIVGETDIDRIALAILQSELSDLPATGIVLSNTDWTKIKLTKDSMGRYIVGDPQAATVPMLWNRPVVATNSMPAGTFLVGSFAYGAQVFDRMEKSVYVSTEDSDNFRRNLVTLLAEERLAFTVKQPLAFVTGSLPS